MIESIIANQVYLFGLIAAFIIGGILREEGYFQHFYLWLSSKLQNRKAILGIVSIVGGILPVEGRCSVSAPILDSLVKRGSDGRQKMGIVDYIATHHYYLWSPLEPSVLIFISALGISWVSFIQATIIPLFIYLLFLFLIITFYVKSEDIDFEVSETLPGKNALIPASAILLAIGLMLYDSAQFAFWYTFPFVAFFLWLMSDLSFKKAFSYVRWPVVAMVGGIIALGTIAKSYNGEILSMLEGSNLTIMGLFLVGFLGALFMGSSSKYAGLGAAILSITSVAYLPIVVISEFVGYLLSPLHKCLGITKMYFSTPLDTFYMFIVPLAFFLLLGGFATFFLLG